MFHNPGGKLKGLAKVLFWIQIIMFAGFGIAIMFGGISVLGYEDAPNIVTITSGCLLIFLGILVAWISTIALYAFGELVESNKRIEELLRAGNRGQNASAAPAVPKQNVCPFCGTVLAAGAKFRTGCGRMIDQ